MHIKVISVISSYYPELVSMAANAGIIKAIVSFYCASSIRIRHSSDTEGVFQFVMILEYSTGAKKHLVSFLGLKELSLKYARIRPRRIWNQNISYGTETGRKKRQLRCHNGWTVETGASKHTGWHRNRNEQYVFLILWYLVLIEIFRGIQSMKSIIDDNRYQSIPIDIN